MSAAELISTLSTYRWLVIGTVACFVSISLLAVIFLPRVYRAEVVLMPVETESGLPGSQLLGGQLSGLASLANINLGSNSQKDEAVAILRSRRFTTGFINDLNLLPVLYPDDWDEGAGDWKKSSADRIPTIWDAVKIFDEDIRRIAENRQAGVMTLSIDWTDPDISAAWANAIVEKVNNIVREEVIHDSEKSIEFLMRELESTNIVEIRQGIYSLIEHHTQRKVLANVQEEYAFKVIDPAVAPDIDNYESPRVLQLLLVGVILGCVAGVFAALLARFVMQIRGVRSGAHLS